MTTQLLAIMAAAGLVTAGVAGSTETRSAAAIPAASMVSLSQASKAKGLPRVATARQGNRPDCSLQENRDLPACSAPGRGGGGGVSGGVLAAIAAGLGVGAIVIAAKNDSNG